MANESPNENSDSSPFEFLDDPENEGVVLSVQELSDSGKTESVIFSSVAELRNLNNLTSRNLSYDTDDMNEMQENFVSFNNFLNNDIRNSISVSLDEFNTINEKTFEILNKDGINGDSLSRDFWTTLNYTLIDYTSYIISKLKAVKNDQDGENDNTGGGAGSQNVSDINGSPDSSTIDDSANIENPNISDIIGNGVVLGTIILTEAVTLYEIIGGVGTQANLTGNYSVIGIVKENDKYYYKVIDSETKKVYYMEITDDVKFQTEYKNLLHVKENAMMLNSMEIGSDNFVKLADPNTIYFIQNETENNGITFYNVIDANDGKSYYIPASDSVETVPLDSIASIVDTPTTETPTVAGEEV